MKHEPRPAIHMEKQLEWAHKMGGMESQGISRAGQTVLTRLMESQIWHPPASSVTLWERAQKRDSGLCPPFCLVESCLPALALMPDTSAPPCVPLVSFKLRPWCWSSEGVSLSKCVLVL